MKKTMLAVALAGVLAIGGIFSVSAADSSAETEAGAKTLSVQLTHEDINDKGNVKLPLSREEMEGAGYSFGDMLTLEIGALTIDLPFGSSYSDVDSGSPAERYEIIADSNIRKSLRNMFGVSDLASADLSKCAEKYLAGIGMSSGSLEALENNLSADAEALSPAA